MSAFDQELSRGDFERCRWEEVVATAPTKDCQEYSYLFLGKASQARKESDPAAEAVFTVLFVATNAQLDPDDHDQPFGPRFVHQAGGLPRMISRIRTTPCWPSWLRRSPIPR